MIQRPQSWSCFKHPWELSLQNMLGVLSEAPGAEGGILLNLSMFRLLAAEYLELR